ncbi:MAG TPA: hypothetical protein VJN21_08945 [Candidatus Acidoferrales bacterium]|nr:hypothetical protein [Candidatus Acidoferrales bacterium]
MGGPATLAALGFAFALLLPVLLFLLAVWRRWLWLVCVGLVGYGSWAVLQIQSWWIPWIFGANENALRDAAFLKNTFRLFPSTPAHPAPDAMHFVLDLLLFASVVTIVIGLSNRSDFSRQS